MAHRAPTKGFSRPSPNMAMLSAPFGYNYPPSPVPPFLLTQNLSKSHAGYNRLHPGVKLAKSCEVCKTGINSEEKDISFTLDNWVQFSYQ